MHDWKAEVHRRLEGASIAPDRLEAIVEELAQHLEDRHAELCAGGADDTEARRLALRELQSHDTLVRGLATVAPRPTTDPIVPGATGRSPLSDLAQDLRHGLRTMIRTPVFTLAAVLALAIGIGGTTAIFSLVNSILLKQLPFTEPDRLVWAWSRRLDPGPRPFNLPDFIDYRDQNRTLLGIAAFGNWSVTLTGRGDPERLQGLRFSANAFTLLGVGPAIGRTLLPDDDTPGREHVVVLGHDLWRRRFGADPALVGQSLTLNGAAYTVIGVLPPEFIFPVRDAQMAIPLAPDADPSREVRGSTNSLRALARLGPGISREAAQADLSAIAERMRRLYPEANGAKIGVALEPLHERIVGDYRLALWVLLGAVATVLLITCVNLANLALVQAAGRRREMAIRTALGATRGRLVQQLLTERILLALVGGGVGLLLAVYGIPLLVSLSPASLPRLAEVGVDLRVLGFTLALSVVAGLAFGLAPAWQAARVELDATLRESARGGSGGRRQSRTRGVLVVSEIALSLVLLVGAGLLIRSFQRLQAVDPGFDAGRLLAARLSLPKSRYADRASVTRFHDALARNLEAIPGVERAGTVSALPLSGTVAAIPFSIAGRATPPGEAMVAAYAVVDPGYFETLRIPLVAGRGFDPHDTATSAPVVLISRSLAHSHWPDGDAVGAHLLLDDNDVGPRRVEVVGVVGDVRQESLDGEPARHIYLTLPQMPEDGVGWLIGNQYWIVRSTGDPAALQAQVRQAIQAVDPDAPTSDLRTMDQYLAASVAPRRFNLWLLTVFAGMALALAATGLYGVIAYGVAQRQREIGIRMALGAGRRDVLALVVGQGLRLALTGVALGVATAALLTRCIASLLYEVPATDVPTFLTIAALLIGVALLACYLPARRATRVDPLVALRTE